MARILVTGASGFIGSHVVGRLRALGHAVHATGRDTARLRIAAQAGASVAGADLASDALGPLVDGCEAVVHCAALSSPWDRPENFWRANVVATERLLAASRGAGVRRFVHLGSPSIYFRYADQFDVAETFSPPARWITEYARSKWESEQRVRAAADARFGTLVLRPRAVFGERDNAILPRLLAVAERGWFPLVHGGEALIDVTCVDNLSQAVAAALEADVRADGRAYNISNGAPVRVRELVTMLFDALARDVRLVPIPRRVALALATVAEAAANLRPGRPEPRLTRYGIGVIGYSQTLDITRARTEMGYVPAVSVAEGLSQFAASWRPHAHA